MRTTPIAQVARRRDLLSKYKFGTQESKYEGEKYLALRSSPER